MSRYNKSQSGFTIVELLTVIIVIGILSAITIVAYNGIQNRAKVSEAIAGLNQAKKKLELYKVDNGLYPVSGNLASAGVSDSDVTYQYTSDGSTYCMTGTAGNVSYKVTDTTTPTQGGCSGHGQGGVAAITNLATNPSFETSTPANTNGNATRTNPTVGDAYAGNRVTRFVRNDTNGSGPWWDVVNPISPGTTYTACIFARGTDNAGRSLSIEWINSAGNSIISSVTLQSSIVVSTAWSRYCGTATAPAGAGRLRLTFYGWGGIIGNYFDIDAVMVLQGSTTYNYADGSTTDWVWNGTPHNSTSTGPAL